jgi:hypothetical protein
MERQLFGKKCQQRGTRQRAIIREVEGGEDILVASQAAGFPQIFQGRLHGTGPRVGHLDENAGLAPDPRIHRATRIKGPERMACLQNEQILNQTRRYTQTRNSDTRKYKNNLAAFVL